MRDMHEQAQIASRKRKFADAAHVGHDDEHLPLRRQQLAQTDQLRQRVTHVLEHVMHVDQ